MPRNLYEQEPEAINYVFTNGESAANPTKLIEIATRNRNKLKEFERILTGYQVIGKDLKVEEIQSLDPHKVLEYKAKEAYRQNGNNPILVEDTSLSIKGLGDRPGTYVVDFFEDMTMRKLVAEEWLHGKDRTAVARVLLGLYDGIETYIWEGKVIGAIAESLRGGNGFGWDDMFIPEGDTRTFAEMTDSEKDGYSMRVRALQKFMQNPAELRHQIFQLPEPYDQELRRVQKAKLQDPTALKFAFQLECLTDQNPSNSEFVAANYSPLHKTENMFFNRYLQSPDTKSLGLILTDVDRKHIKLHRNGSPELWQMGPERRTLALAQRAEFFLEHQDPEVHRVLDDLELHKQDFPTRNNRRSLTLEAALGIEGYSSVTKAISLKEIGYKKISSEKRVSRTHSAKYGLFNVIGKHPRSIFAVGCLPYISGWRDVIVASAISHMLIFIHRNNINAIDFQNQVELAISARNAIKDLGLSARAEQRALSNIGAALGCNPVEDVKKARVLYEEAGIRAFRIYTINSDPRVIETAAALRAEFGDEIEIFVGQLVDKRQAEKLIDPAIRVDGLIYGHGGGRQCTSATNGMALSTLEELYDVLIDRRFNHTSILVEGGIGEKVGGLMVMGVDCILRNGQFANCVIEQGDVYYRHKNGKFCQPYHGSASAPTMIIESLNSDNATTKLYYSGRTRNVEGKAGYIFYEEKANSLSFYVDQFKHYAARTLADLGVLNMRELREFLNSKNDELLRLVSFEAEHTSQAWGR